MADGAKIAYCITVHKDETQVQRLIKRLSNPNNHFFVKIFRATDDKSKEAWQSALKPFDGSNLHYELSQESVWGAFGQVQTTMDIMRYFAAKEYDYFINLSGQCYPLMSNEEIGTFFQNKENSYIEHFSLPTENWTDGGMPRLNYHYIKVGERRTSKIPRLRRSLPYGFKPYGGPNWFCLNRKHVDHILSFTDEHPRLAKFFRTSLSPDEMFFQTILLNSPLKDNLTQDSLRYIDWFRKAGPLPAVLTSDDLPALKRCGKMFARKFDIRVDSQVLDAIDAQILERTKK